METHYTVSGWPERFITKEILTDEKDYLIMAGTLQPRQAVKFRARSIGWKHIEEALKKQWPDRYFLCSGHGNIYHIICMDKQAEDILCTPTDKSDPFDWSTRQMRERRGEG